MIQIVLRNIVHIKHMIIEDNIKKEIMIMNLKEKKLKMIIQRNIVI